MRTRVAAALVFATSIALGCATVPPAPPPTPPPAPPSELAADASGYPDDEPVGVAAGDACARAGRVVWRCQCPEAGRTEGEAFPAFCRSHWPGVDGDCIAGVRSCAELPACHLRCGRS